MTFDFYTLKFIEKYKKNFNDEKTEINIVFFLLKNVVCYCFVIYFLDVKTFQENKYFTLKALACIIYISYKGYLLL